MVHSFVEEIKHMRSFFALMGVFCLGALCFLVSCLPERTGSAGSGMEASHKAVRVGLALTHSGLGDQSFNDMLYNGFIEAYRRFDIGATLRIAEREGERYLRAVFEDLIRTYKCNIIIAAEGHQTGPIVYDFARRYPDVIFMLFEYDEEGPLPNLITISFAQNEGSFVAGFLAARHSQSKKVAFLGGVNVAAVRDFEAGFAQGIRYGDPSCALIVRYVSYVPDFSGFNDPRRGNELAKELYDEGVDIIFSVAGATGGGIIQAAQESGRYVIGVDSDQDHMAPGHVLTSMMKRLDVAVLRLLEERVTGELQTGDRRFDYKNGGVGLSRMEYTRDKFSAAFMETLRGVEEMVKDGRISVINTLRR
jgi:basic membrane protein A